MGAPTRRVAVTSLRAFLAKHKAPFETPIHVVLGNEAADVDSISCAIALAYLGQTSSTLPMIPIANIPRSELPLRRDALLALSLADISPSDLLFIEELPGGLASSGALTLVDHNALAGHQKDAASLVIGIIDHHADEGEHANASPRIVERVGSCSTLVAELFDEARIGDMRDAARLLACAIMLDTANLKDGAKTTSRDEKAFARVCEVSEWNEGRRNEVYEMLKKARRDVEGLDMRDLLLRDLKTVQGGGVDVAIASVGVRPEELVKSAEQDGFAGCVELFAKERDVSCVAVLVTSGGKEGTQRHLAITKGEVGDVLQRVLCEEAAYGVGMVAVEIDGGEGVWWFRLKDASMSRKIIAPKVVQALGVVVEHLGEKKI